MPIKKTAQRVEPKGIFERPDGGYSSGGGLPQSGSGGAGRGSGLDRRDLGSWDMGPIYQGVNVKADQAATAERQRIGLQQRVRIWPPCWA